MHDTSKEDEAFLAFYSRIGQPHDDLSSELEIQHVNRAYAEGHLTIEQLERRLDWALAYLKR